MFIVEIPLVFSELRFIISNQAIVDSSSFFEVRYGTIKSRPIVLLLILNRSPISYPSIKQIDMTPQKDWPILPFHSALAGTACTIS